MERTIEMPSNIKRPEVPAWERAKDERIKRIRKLRWMGMEDEAEEVRRTLRQIEPGVALLAGPYDTD